MIGESVSTEFDGAVALVTGASSGIGRAVALAFGAAGARVVVAARRSDECDETVRQIHSAGGGAIAVPTDVTDSRQVAALVARAVEHFGSLQYACNSAGIEGARPTTLLDYPENAWDDVMAVNLKGLFLSMKYEIPALLAEGGAIVNIASVSGLFGSTGNMAYTTSKWGQIGLTKAAAAQYVRRNVRINAVAPGFVDTPMAERIRGTFADPAGGVEMMGKAQPLADRLITPDEVADTVLWLCSARAALITGQVIGVDGGFMLSR